MVLTVRDEVVLEVPTGEVDAAVPLVREVMETVCELAVPLRVDMAVGATWADAQR
jgi:DNA polymerase-1